MGTLSDDTHLWQAIGVMMDETICHHQPMAYIFCLSGPNVQTDKKLADFCFFNYKFHQAPEKLYKPICKL